LARVCVVGVVVKTVTAKHFESYKRFCLEWRERLGVHWVELVFEHKTVGDATAQAQLDGSGTVGTLRLCRKWDTPRPLNNATLHRLARHEVLHLLVDQTSQPCCEDGRDLEVERLVCRIEAIMDRETARGNP